MNFHIFDCIEGGDYTEAGIYFMRSGFISIDDHFLLLIIEYAKN